MKKTILIVFLVLFATAGCLVYLPPDREGGPRSGERTYDRYGRYDSRDMDISYFYEYLAPHGTWINYPPYGYVWIPRHMRYDWRPYSYGRWVWTDYGWTWVSGFEWGWIPFHYGRWGWDRDFGWFWVPDTVWGPAWVTWRTGDFYIGWAALPPEAEFRPGFGIHSTAFGIPDPYWVFIDGRHFLYERLDRYVLPYERNLTIINFTVINTNIYVRGDRIINEGIDADHVRRMTQREITKHQLRDPQRPGSSRVSSGELVLHRPSISKNQLAKPKTVLSREEAREKISSWELKDTEKTLDETDLKMEQERERRLLDESQADEVKILRRRVDEDKKSARSNEEKQVLEEEYKTKISTLKEKHEEEKSGLSERHKQEKEKVEASRLKKKE